MSLADGNPGSRPLKLRCSVCGKPPWWSLPREGDPCYDDDGGQLETVEILDGVGDLLAMSEEYNLIEAPSAVSTDTLNAGRRTPLG